MNESGNTRHCPCCGIARPEVTYCKIARLDADRVVAHLETYETAAKKDEGWKGEDDSGSEHHTV